MKTTSGKRPIEFYREAYAKFEEIEKTEPGKSCGELGRILDVSNTTISRWRRCGYNEPKLAPKDRETIAEAGVLLDTGYSYTQAARIMGNITPKTIAHHFPGRGWKSNVKPETSNADDYSLDAYV